MSAFEIDDKMIEFEVKNPPFASSASKEAGFSRVVLATGACSVYVGLNGYLISRRRSDAASRYRS